MSVRRTGLSRRHARSRVASRALQEYREWPRKLGEEAEDVFFGDPRDGTTVELTDGAAFPDPGALGEAIWIHAGHDDSSVGLTEAQRHPEFPLLRNHFYTFASVAALGDAATRITGG